MVEASDLCRTVTATSVANVPSSPCRLSTLLNLKKRSGMLRQLAVSGGDDFDRSVSYSDDLCTYLAFLACFVTFCLCSGSPRAPFTASFLMHFVTSWSCNMRGHTLRYCRGSPCVCSSKLIYLSAPLTSQPSHASPSRALATYWSLSGWNLCL